MDGIYEMVRGFVENFLLNAVLSVLRVKTDVSVRWYPTFDDDDRSDVPIRFPISLSATARILTLVLAKNPRFSSGSSLLVAFAPSLLTNNYVSQKNIDTPRET